MHGLTQIIVVRRLDGMSSLNLVSEASEFHKHTNANF